MTTNYLLSYFAYLSSGIALMLSFMMAYERITPYAEIRLIREGNLTAGLSFGGALLGFTLSLASSALHASSWTGFLGWGALAGLMQLVAFLIVAFGLRQVREHVENDNRAVGLALFFMSVSVGTLNAAALS